MKRGDIDNYQKKCPQGYPKIRFNEIQGGREYSEGNSNLLTQIRYFDKTTN